MRSKWLLSNIKLIFEDGLIKQYMLTKPNISDTCVLRGDYYHLMYKDFPNAHNFGELVFICISKCLCNFLICKNVDEQENSFKSPAIVLKDMPLKLEQFTEIYNRPQYYAGYYCRDIPGNLKIKGSASAESNYFFIVSHFDESGARSIVYHSNTLMERQNNFISIDTKA